MTSASRAVLVLLIALAGFSVAQPLFQILITAPEFLVAHQASRVDTWSLALGLGLLLPALLFLPFPLLDAALPRAARLYAVAVSTLLAALLLIQLIPPAGKLPPVMSVLLCVCVALPVCLALLYTRWRLLASILALIALAFPVRFLLLAPNTTGGTPEDTPIATLQGAAGVPEIIFVVFDELPLATLLTEDMEVDADLYPAFARLQSLSTWYFNATTVSDSTTASMAALLSGQFPSADARAPTHNSWPENLFTLLRESHEFNVLEATTQLCPPDLCRVYTPGAAKRLGLTLADLGAVYLNRITPQAWRSVLPDVDGQWTGFWSGGRVFYPDDWKKNVQVQARLDRPGVFEGFVASLKAGPGKPVLNFVHSMLPHEPLAYFPDGSSYGLQWIRGKDGEAWGHHEWALASIRQRHYLQAALADRLLGQLLDRLDNQELMHDSLLIVTADHGASFQPGEHKRAVAESTAGDILRVPLFIKAPGQAHPAVSKQPAMLVDVLPTALSLMNATASDSVLDGLDLGLQDFPVARTRLVVPTATRNMQAVDEGSLRIGQEVANGRAQLMLGDPYRAIWGIGPFGALRGQESSQVCESRQGGLRIGRAAFKPLAGSAPDRRLPAYVAGRISGKRAPEKETPFIISSGGTIAASGVTWQFEDKWLYFALVEPGLVAQEGWSPEIMLVDKGQCLVQK